MNNLVVLNDKTMSSQEIAELCEARHNDVVATIARLYEQGVLRDRRKTPRVYQPEGGGRPTVVYDLSYRDCMVIVSGYQPEVRAKIIDRWMELEKAGGPQLPQTFAQALRLAAEQAEVIESQALALEAAQPAIQMVARYVEAKSSKCLSDVAKILGQKPQTFIRRLADEGVIFKRSGSWVPYQYHIDCGRFTVKTGESKGHAFHQTRVEPLGIEWLARTYS